MIAKGTRVTGMKTARRWWNVDGMCPDGMKITGQRDFRSTIEQTHLGTQRETRQQSGPSKQARVRRTTQT